MGADRTLIVPLHQAGRHGEAVVGGKGAMLGRLIDRGHRVPGGFCISTAAYARFAESADLPDIIRMELGRKALESMRWEEIWDAALRIRSAFMTAPMPPELSEAIVEAFHRLGARVLAVRSSAPGEDAADRSYAGLHESLVGVTGEGGLLDAVRVVWASLWSDAALLYRRELNADPGRSRMAVVVQEFIESAPSGVGFGVDPRKPESDREIVEAVPGPCQELVSGEVDPDRWILKRSSGEPVEWVAGKRGQEKARPILERDDLDRLHDVLRRIASEFGWEPDVEWTGASGRLTILQARPVTGPRDPQTDEREWYLSLRPGRARLRALCERVTNELIPALETEGSRLAREAIESYTDSALADVLREREAVLAKWKKIYWDEFIPFAHGVRQLGLYYNDAVRPKDTYEFVELLEGEKMIASERNAALGRLASGVRRDESLLRALERLEARGAARTRESWREESLRSGEIPESFREEFAAFLDRYMNVVYAGESLDTHPDRVLRIILELARAGESVRRQEPVAVSASRAEQRLLDAVGEERREEALEVVRIARLSWRLRDDDNVLIGQLEKQLDRAVQIAAERLRRQKRLDASASVTLQAAASLAEALLDEAGGPVSLATPPTNGEAGSSSRSSRASRQPRQMIGQPAAPGLATGRARVVRVSQDLGLFHSGEVLVCDAIQPTMTHLVPLAQAVVERRGGMLIHGAIIARELGIPCVNGVEAVTELLENGDLVTVDGYLGIVTVGPPEFDLELSRSGPSG